MRAFTEEQQMFRDSYRRFVTNEVAPHMERWRAEGRTIHAMRFNRAPGPAAPPGD